MRKIKTAVIGLGQRGVGLLKSSILPSTRCVVTAVCDLYEDRVQAGQELVQKAGFDLPVGTTDYHELLHRDDIEAAVISCAWEGHSAIACAFMEAGKAVALEVGGAYDIEDCWQMVNTQERTGVPFMFLENCCFGENELTITAMARKGLFGELVHCSGAYGHDLRVEITGGEKNRHYRLRNYLHRNCENYPTHELGPIARLLNINRGNRMVSLVSVATKAVGINEYLKAHGEPTRPWKQGDIVHTIITCANGETILLKLDTTLPRRYGRDLVVRGTKGMVNVGAMETFYGDGDTEVWEDVDKGYCGTFRKDIAEHAPAVWKKITPEEREAGHGGMDWIEFEEFFSALQENRPMPIDVYDAAAWMSITALSEQSVAQGGAPVAIPDFTRGKWLITPERDVIDLA